MAVDDAHETTWTASAFIELSRTFVPWIRKRRSAGHTHVFPRVTTRGGQPHLDDASHIGTRHLEEVIGRVAAEYTWHSLRLGVEQALDAVHTVPGHTSPPVEAWVRNVITMRSNRAVRGSRDVYIKDNLDPVFAATRHLHAVTPTILGGFATRVGGEVAPHSSAAPFATQCRRCDTDIPLEDEGSLCDSPGCMWTLCVDCWPDAAAPLLCPEHAEDDQA